MHLALAYLWCQPIYYQAGTGYCFVPCPLGQPRGASDWLHQARVDPAGAGFEDPDTHVLAAAAAMMADGALICPRQHLVTVAGVSAYHRSVGAAAAARQESDTLTPVEQAAAAGAEAKHERDAAAARNMWQNSDGDAAAAAEICSYASAAAAAAAAAIVTCGFVSAADAAATVTCSYASAAVA